MTNKNNGPLLTSTFKGSFRNIPEEFLAKVGLKTEVQKVPKTTETDNPEGLLVESKVEQEVTGERKKTNTELLSEPSDSPLVSEVRLPSGQVGTLTRTLVPEGTPLTLDVLTEEANQKNLGNGLLDQNQIQAPEIFQDVEVFKEVDDGVPERFRFAIPRTQTQSIVEGAATVPTLTAAQLRVSERQLSVYRKLVTQLARTGITLPVTLVSYRTNDKGQVVTVTETLRVVATPPTPTATLNVVTQSLGNGNEVVTLENLPSVFPAAKYSKQREDVTPSEFRVAIPATETEVTVAGTATMPTLDTGDLSATEEQLTEFVKLVKLLTRAGVSLPVVLSGKEVNNRGQVVTITRTLRVAGSDPTPSETLEFVVQPLGDGNVVETKREIDAVFGQTLYEKEVMDAFPSEFRAMFPVERLDEVTTGAAANPTLSTFDLQRSEEQITMFTKMVKTLTRSGISLPVELTSTAVITEYGGGKVNVRIKIGNADSLTEETGAGIVSSKITKLGEGHEVRETVERQAGSWPVLAGTKVDRQTGIAEQFTEQVVAAGTTGGLSAGVLTEVEPLDFVRSKARASTLAAGTTLTNYIVAILGSTNVNVPAQLMSLTGVAELSAGTGGYDETGTWLLGNRGSGSLSLQCRAQASAAAMIDLNRQVKQIWGAGVPCTFYLFFVPNETSRQDVLDKLTAKAGATVNPWPKFVPEALSFVCAGGKINVSLELSARAAESTTVDYLGAIQLTGYARSSGQGSSSDVGISQKVIQIPPCIHDALSVTLPSPIAISASTIASISNGASSASVPLTTVTATAKVTPTSVGATSGQATIPTSGLYLHRLTGEVSSLNPLYTKYVAEVVNFSDLQ